MNTDHIMHFPYDPNNRGEWLALRNHMQGAGDPLVFRAGGSDIGKITNTNEYTPDIVFFYHCCGWQKYEPEQNLLMYRGRKSEVFVYENYFQYFDPRMPLPEVMMANEDQGRVVRTARHINEIVYNTRYPRIFANLDYNIDPRPYDFGQHPGEFPYYKYSGKEGVLELKIMKSEEMNKYLSGIPECYVEQHQTYMGVSELPWGEIFVLQDGVVPIPFPYQFNPERFTGILGAVDRFADKVLTVKKIIAQGAHITETEALIHELQPEPQGTPQWYAFLKAQHRPDMMKPTIDGPDDCLQKIIRYEELKMSTAPAEIEMQLLSNQLMAEFVSRQVMTMTFGVLGQLKFHGKWNLGQAAKKIYNNYKLQQS